MRVAVDDNPFPMLPCELRRAASLFARQTSLYAEELDRAVRHYVNTVGATPSTASLARQFRKAVAWARASQQLLLGQDAIPWRTILIGSLTYELPPMGRRVAKAHHLRDPYGTAGRYVAARENRVQREMVSYDAGKWVDSWLAAALRTAGMSVELDGDYRSLDVYKPEFREGETARIMTRERWEYRTELADQGIPLREIVSVKMPWVSFRRLRQHGLYPAPGMVPLDVLEDRFGDKMVYGFFRIGDEELYTRVPLAKAQQFIKSSSQSGQSSQSGHQV